MATTTLLMPSLCFREEDSNGQPLAFGTVQSFQAGTVTPVATYTDSTGVTPNSNPLTLNNRGEANIWLLPNVSYKFLVKDSAGNQVRVVDNVQNSQLITLYGGVDTGVANAYVLNFTSNFSSYQDGITIEWIASNTNTTASTLNVNGLGVVSIVNQDGTALSANQIIANQVTTLMYKGGNWLLLSSGISPSITRGLFTPSWGGFSVNPSGTMSWQVVGSRVDLFFTGVATGTSNSTSMTFSNLPTNLRPSTSATNARVVCWVIDNGAEALGGMDFGLVGTVTFFKGSAPPSATGFTNPGSKGLPFSWTASYWLG